VSEKDTGGKAAGKKVRTRQERRERLKKLKVLKEARRTAREAAAAKLAAQSVIEAPATRVAPAKESVAKIKAPAAAAKPKPAPVAPVAAPDIEKQKQRVIDALERDVAELSRLSTPTGEQSTEIERIRREVEELKHDFYTNLGVWQRVLLARHPLRPYTDDYIRLLFEDFSEIHGDRNFSDDPA
jgi:chemotaxis protein histidine kinase CheA